MKEKEEEEGGTEGWREGEGGGFVFPTFFWSTCKNMDRRYSMVVVVLISTRYKPYLTFDFDGKRMIRLNERTDERTDGRRERLRSY